MLSTEGFSREVLWRIQQPAIVIFCRQQVDLVEEPRGANHQEPLMTASGSNFSVLDLRRPEIARLLVAMLQAREATGRRSWSHPQEPASEEWWPTCCPILAPGAEETRAAYMDAAAR
jgi:hypothetical protein